MSTEEIPIAAVSHRESEIIHHVNQNVASMNLVIRRLFCPETTPNAVSKITARLVAKGYLNKYPLTRPYNYFVLGPKAATALGRPMKRTEPLGAQSLRANIGALFFCCFGQVLRRRLTPEELQPFLADAPAAYLDLPYYVDTEGDKPRFAQIRTDFAGSPAYRVRKCQSDLERMSRISTFQDWISTDRLMIVLLTTTPEKARAIAVALQQHVWPISFRIGVVPNILL